jgi:hypothetical protein
MRTPKRGSSCRCAGSVALAAAAVVAAASAACLPARPAGTFRASHAPTLLSSGAVWLDGATGAKGESLSLLAFAMLAALAGGHRAAGVCRARGGSGRGCGAGAPEAFPPDDRLRRPALTLGVLALGLSGCSWVFVHSAPEPITTPQGPIDCTASNTAPAIDSACATVSLAAMSAVLSNPSCTGSGCLNTTQFVATAVSSAALAVVCGFSAAQGFQKVNRCQKQQELSLWCRGGEVGACQKLTPGWLPPMPVPLTPREPMPSAPPPPPYAPPPLPPEAPPPGYPPPPPPPFTEEATP